MQKVSVKQTEDTAKTGSILKRWFYRNHQWLYSGGRPNWYAKLSESSLCRDRGTEQPIQWSSVRGSGGPGSYRTEIGTHHFVSVGHGHRRWATLPGIDARRQHAVGSQCTSRWRTSGAADWR